MTKALKVTSVGEYGEHTISHPLWDCDYQDKLVIATLQGVMRAGHVIKAFEIVEVQ